MLVVRGLDCLDGTPLLDIEPRALRPQRLSAAHASAAARRSATTR